MEPILQAWEKNGLRVQEQALYGTKSTTQSSWLETTYDEPTFRPKQTEASPLKQPKTQKDRL